MAAYPAPVARWRGLYRSTIVRFITLAAVAQLVVIGSVLVFVQTASQRALIEQEHDTAAALRDDLLAVYRNGGQAGLAHDIQVRLQTIKGERIAILLVGSDGEYVAGNIRSWPDAVPLRANWLTAQLYRAKADKPDPIGLIATPLPDGGHLITGIVIGTSMQLTHLYREALTTAFALAIILTLVMSLMAGKILANRVSGIALTAHAVSNGALSERVPIDGSGDAFDALGNAINAMLERIEALVSQLRMMTDGLAHDLKSPVTRLMSTVERAIVEVRDDVSLTALERVSREAGALQSMLSTALLISRTEAGFGSDMMLDTDVAALLNDVAEIYGPLAEENAFAIRVSAPSDLRFRLHRELVGQAIGNLIENAIKYAEGGNRIDLNAVGDQEQLTIIVADNGAGIAARQRSQALKRFGRLDPARSKPGSGLGLSLVEAVCSLHHGEILLSDNVPGLRVLLVLRGA